MTRASVALVVVLTGRLAAAAAEVESLVENGVENRISIVILGDGYRAEEQEDMSAQARAVVQQLLDATPFPPHAALFTIRLVHLVSNVSGMGNGAPLDTALHSYNNCRGHWSLLCTDTGTALRMAAEAFPEFDFAVVLVNSAVKAGSGGAVVTAAAGEEGRDGDLLVHEMGHALGNLADEADDPYPGYPPCSPVFDCPEHNVTLRTFPSDIKWNAWIDAGVPLPTPEYAGYGDVVGLFEGARYQATGLYRPVDWNCRMHGYWNEFCPVCTEALVREIWSRVRPFDAIDPTPGEISWSACDGRTFSIRLAPYDGVVTSWAVDSLGVCEKPLLTFPPGSLSIGQHYVGVLVRVPSDLVRSDPQERLREVIAWRPDVTACEGQAVPARGAPLCTGWAVPVAHAAAPSAVDEGTPVVLDASGSTDADGDALQLSFEQVAGAAVALEVAPGGALARFVAPQVDADTVLRFEVVASDGVLASAPATLPVTVRDVATPQPNRPPQISVSAPSAVESGATGRVVVQASDADGDAVALACVQSGGPPVQLVLAMPGEWTFVAPDVAAESAIALSCTATDGDLQSDASVSVIVRPRAGPATSSGGGSGGCATSGADPAALAALAYGFARCRKGPRRRIS